MSELDVIREQIAYLKAWLGILVVTDISLLGWMISNFEATPLQILVACVCALFSISLGVVLIHRRNDRMPTHDYA